MSEARPRQWAIRDLLAWARPWFEERDVDSARLTAEILLAHVLSVPRIRLYTDLDRPLEQAELARFKDLVQRRAKGEPTQYLVGTQDFYGRTFQVDRRALIPRPETELVAERALRHVPKDAKASFADVGCGSGALGLTLALERPESTVVLTDVSPDAAALARENAARLGVQSRVDIRLGDLTEPLGDECFDVLVSNLPYVSEGEKTTLAVNVRDHEPHLALFAGDDGLSLYRRFLPAAAAHVLPGGLLVVEHALEHGASLPALLPEADWETPVVERDLAGLERFTWAVRRG